MFPGGASASSGDVPALHCLRVHAPHLGQVQQGLEREDRTLDLLLSTLLNNWICVPVYPLPIGLFLFTFIIFKFSTFFLRNLILFSDSVKKLKKMVKLVGVFQVFKFKVKAYLHSSGSAILLVADLDTVSEQIVSEFSDSWRKTSYFWLYVL